ncbi:MAG: hypothetical protein ACLF0G_06610 [Candidatus Brocadiia bacterium]
MIARLLGLDNLSRVEWYLRQPWPRIVLFLLVLAGVAYTAALYRRQTGISKRRRAALGVLRALLYAVILVLLFEPVLGLETSVRLRRTVLVLLDTSQSMALQDPRRRREELEEAALCLGKIPFERQTFELDARDRAEIAKASRFDLARGLLLNPELDVFRRLARDHKVRFFHFDERLQALGGDGEELARALRALRPEGQATRLGVAVQRAVAQYGGQPIAAVVVLSDGASNEGAEPVDVAGRLETMHGSPVPVYTVGFGLPDPPDLRVKRLLVQDTIFASEEEDRRKRQDEEKDKVPVRVALTSTGYEGRTVPLVLRLDGAEVARTSVPLKGKPQFVEMSFLPTQRKGTYKLEAELPTLPGETTEQNNAAQRSIRVIDQDIKVLYVEGKPRWEYRYLRAVLLRDHRLDVKFLMTQGDTDLAKASELYLARFPEIGSEAFVFDLVILGDVPADYFTPAQLARMEELVKEHGGSLLVLAGHHHPLASYIGTRIAPILPVRLHPSEAWHSVGAATAPQVTDEGIESTVVRLLGPAEGDYDLPEEERTKRLKERNNQLWARVRPIYQVPAVEGKKSGATVLAALPPSPQRPQPYPLVAWHRYGSGKALFVGTDQLWRLRYKEGDTFHARFWGQAIQFLTLSRLLGENKPISLEVDRKSYRTGDQVQIFANVLNENFEPVTTRDYRVYLENLDEPSDVRAVELRRVEDAEGLYQATVAAEQEGRFRLRTSPDQVEIANTVEFRVVTTPLEQLEPAMQEHVLAKMAELSGGRRLGVRELMGLPQRVAQEQLTTAKRTEEELWDLPLVFVGLLACAAVEWFFRRRYDLI